MAYKRILQILRRSGNATVVTLPRHLLYELNWVCGQGVIVELLEDQTVRVRLPNERDYGPVRPPIILHHHPPEPIK